jgi:hypothetical protein
MMIISAARMFSRDVPSKYSRMADQTHHQNQTNPHHSPWLKHISLAKDTTKTQTVVRFQKKRCITADNDPLRGEIYFS